MIQAEEAFSFQTGPDPIARFQDLKRMTPPTANNPVFYAYDCLTSQHVSLKFFSNLEAKQNAFEREVRILQSLNHTNIVKMIDFGRSIYMKRFSSEVSYIATEFMKNDSLLKRLGPKQTALPDKLARAVFLQMVQAVMYSHSQKIAHMDIKLDNFMLDESFVIKLTDFGLAQNFDSQNLVGRGTPGYRAPEVRLGTAKNLEAADIYSLGITLFELMNGFSPFEEILHLDEYDLQYKMFRVNNQEFWKQQSKKRFSTEFGYEEGFIELINSMLSKNPEERPRADEIKNYDWVKGEIMNGEGYISDMKKSLELDQKSLF